MEKARATLRARQVDPGETCDEGAGNADDAACTSACALATCGDGRVHAGVEACDDGAANADGAACTSGCALATCGDGFVQEVVETCDDADGYGGDGCSPDCFAPIRVSLADAHIVLTGARAQDGFGAELFHAGDLTGDGVDCSRHTGIRGGAEKTPFPPPTACLDGQGGPVTAPPR